MSTIEFYPIIEAPSFDNYNPRDENGKLDLFKLNTEVADWCRRSFVYCDGIDFYKWNQKADYIYSKVENPDSLIIPFLDHFKIPFKSGLANDLIRKLRIDLSLSKHHPIELMETKLREDFTEISPEEQLEPYRCYETDPRADKLRYDYPLFAFNNGLFNFTTGELLPFTPYIIITEAERIYCNWETGLDHPDGRRFLSGLFEDPRTLNTMLDMLAYAVYRTKWDKTAPYLWVLYGKSRTGKSRTFSIIRRLLGGAVATETAENLCDKFGRAVLIGKRASLSEEVTGANLNADWMKDFSDGSGTSEYRTINRKYRESEQHLINCTFCFATNHQIKLGSDSGIAERLRVIPYNINQNKNRELIQTVLDDPKFYSWIAELLYDRWNEIQKRNGRIEESPAVMKASNETIRASSTVKEFLYDTLMDKAIANTIVLPSEINPGLEDDDPETIADMITGDGRLRSRSELFVVYKEWCAKNGKLSLNKSNFNNTVESEYNLELKKTINGFIWIKSRR